jgi:hypothetical protein
MKPSHRKLIKLAKSYDLDLVRLKNHFVFRHRITGRTVSAASSASDHRYLANVLSHFRAAGVPSPTLSKQA